VRDGFALLPGVLTLDECEELKAEERRHRMAVGFGTARNQTLRVAIHLCNRSEPVRRFATAGRHLPFVVDELGPDVCLAHQQYIAKLPDDPDSTSDIPFHQDNGYGTLEPFLDLTVWVALDDCTEENGCLLVVPGSQELGLLDHGRGGTNPVLRQAQLDTSGAVALPMQAGDAVAFSGLLVHGSGPNHTPHERIAMFVRYCPPTAIQVTEGGRGILEDPNTWMVAGASPI
jgi:phytanoyl-CoA hydroxylase